MKFSTRIVTFAAVPALLFSAALAVSFYGLWKTQHNFENNVVASQALSNSVTSMYAQGLQMGQALRNIVLDPENNKAYENHEAAAKEFTKEQSRLESALGTSELGGKVSKISELRKAHANTQAEVQEMVKQQTGQAEKLLVSKETPAWRKLRKELMELNELVKKRAEEKLAETLAETAGYKKISLVLAVLAVVVKVTAVYALRKSVRHDLGAEPTEAAISVRAIAQGDLQVALSADQFPAGSLMSEIASMQTGLRDLIVKVRDSADSITTASAEVAAGSTDLSGRTESAAGQLQETASSVMHVAETANATAEVSQRASKLVSTTAQLAAQGGDEVQQMVQTMGAIEDSSKKIAEILSVIDSIAFQTNILALNAAVEAARAGEQGRGFAVVASEVRSLAGRSGTAAKEIRALINASNLHVQAGAKNVASAGTAMHKIVEGVREVNAIIEKVSALSTEQSSSFAQINVAVRQLDDATQQNAALVEESAAAAASLKDQARGLVDAVSSFKV